MARKVRAVMNNGYNPYLDETPWIIPQGGKSLLNKSNQ